MLLLRRRFNNVRVEVDTRRHATHEAGTVYEETLSGLADGRKQSKRTILSDVSGELRSGTVTGLMGPSGSGKTTLLNVLMKRKSDMGKADVTGSVAMNRKPLPSWFPLVIGYVPQV